MPGPELECRWGAANEPCPADVHMDPGRFEKLAHDRKKQLEILQLAQAQGLDPPSHHFELKTFQTVRCQSPWET